MAWPLAAMAAGAALGMGSSALRGKTDWKSLLFSGLMGGATAGVGAGMFGGGAGAAGGSGISAGTGGAGGAGGWWQKLMGGSSFADMIGAGGNTTSNIGLGEATMRSASGPSNVPFANADSSFFKTAFPGGVAKGSGQGIGHIGTWGGSTPNPSLDSSVLERIGGDSPDKPDSLIKKGKKTSAKAEAAQAPSSSGSTRGGGTSASISGDNLEQYNFASAPGISPVSLPQRSATFDPGFKSLSSSSGLPQGRSSSRYTPQTGMNPTLQKILAGYARDRRGYA